MENLRLKPPSIRKNIWNNAGELVQAQTERKGMSQQEAIEDSDKMNAYADENSNEIRITEYTW